jgi:hypothetical protein
MIKLEAIKTIDAWIVDGEIVEGGLKGFITDFTHDYNKKIRYDQE